MDVDGEVKRQEMPQTNGGHQERNNYRGKNLPLSLRRVVRPYYYPCRCRMSMSMAIVVGISLQSASIGWRGGGPQVVGRSDAFAQLSRGLGLLDGEAEGEFPRIL